MDSDWDCVLYEMHSALHMSKGLMWTTQNCNIGHIFTSVLPKNKFLTMLLAAVTVGESLMQNWQENGVSLK